MMGPFDIVFGFVQGLSPVSLVLGSIGLLGLLISLFLLTRRAMGKPTPGPGGMGMGLGGNWCPADWQREFERVGGTPTPTEAGTPAPTQPMATPSRTPTITPTPTDVCDVEVTVHALSDFNCRTGPSTDFPVVGYLMDGETAVVHARSSSGFPWVVIENPDASPDYCYVRVFEGTIYVESGDVGCLPVQQDPVLPVEVIPIITQIVCKPTLNKTDCVRAGGTWVNPLVGGETLLRLRLT